MIYCHKDYLHFDLPINWCAEEDGENLIVYNPDGCGALIFSFFTIVELKETVDEYISIMAKKFIDRNSIKLHTPLILHRTTENKTVLYGTGTTSDGWFIKLWIVARYPKIVIATYQCEEKNTEIKKCDMIVNSVQFTM